MNNINQKIISDVFNINNKSISNNVEVVIAAIQPQILAIDPSYVLAVSVDSITGDDVINIDEANQEVLLTGTVAGNYGELISVTVTINNKEYDANLDSNNTYLVAVSGSDLVADNLVSVAAFAVDSTENTYNGEIEHSYEVKFEPPAALTLSLLKIVTMMDLSMTQSFKTQ